MAQTFTLNELVNLSIGTPEVGVCNFNALHALLHGLLEHLQLGDVQKTVGEVEVQFIKPKSSKDRDPAHEAPASEESPSKERESAKSVSLFHQLEEKVTKLQNAMEVLGQLPSVPELMARSQAETGGRKYSIPSGSVGPVKDMWQLMQVKKKVEVNEEGVHKAMGSLQELMNSINLLSSNHETMKKDLEKLQQSKTRNTEETTRKLSSFEDQINNLPDPKDFVLWNTLQTMLNKELDFDTKIALLALQPDVGDVETDAEGEKVPGTLRAPTLTTLHQLSQMSDNYEGLKVRLGLLEVEIKRQMEELEKKGHADDLVMRLDLLENALQILQNENNQDRELLAALKRKLEEMEEDFESRLAVLQADHGELQGILEKLDQLEEKKVDKEVLEVEINGKADKKSLESKVSRTLLDATAQQLSAMMQELLNKVCAQEKDWQKVLEKLLCDMDCKLDRMELDPLKKQLEDRWKKLKKQLRNGPDFEADSAAVFRKQLLERFKCLSCAKSTRMSPGPHLITIAASALHPRIRPTTAPELDSLNQPKGSPSTDYCDNVGRNSLRPCGGTHTVTGPVGRRSNRGVNYQTVYQYSDPSPVYRREEVELQGIDGIMYKGRIDSKLPTIYQMQDDEPLEKKSNGIKQQVTQPETSPASSKCVYCNQTCMGPRPPDPSFLQRAMVQDVANICRCLGRTTEPDLAQQRPTPQDISNICRCLAAMCSPQPTQEFGNACRRGSVKVFCPPQNGTEGAIHSDSNNSSTPKQAVNMKVLQTIWKAYCPLFQEHCRVKVKIGSIFTPWNIRE
ncbi:glutamine-rich protein 2-like isoform X3 [Narcine bancroftii]|uniref:glutamine-rich protein 2-like isoform X3 n=1 Tax=Narcine bancroftii TaxID=1343680 RepID=UPI0038313B1B